MLLIVQLQSIDMAAEKHPTIASPPSESSSSTQLAPNPSSSSFEHEGQGVVETCTGLSVFGPVASGPIDTTGVQCKCKCVPPPVHDLDPKGKEKGKEEIQDEDEEQIVASGPNDTKGAQCEDEDEEQIVASGPNNTTGAQCKCVPPPVHHLEKVNHPWSLAGPNQDLVIELIAWHVFCITYSSEMYLPYPTMRVVEGNWFGKSKKVSFPVSCTRCGLVCPTIAAAALHETSHNVRPGGAFLRCPICPLVLLEMDVKRSRFSVNTMKLHLINNHGVPFYGPCNYVRLLSEGVIRELSSSSKGKEKIQDKEQPVASGQISLKGKEKIYEEEQQVAARQISVKGKEKVEDEEQFVGLFWV